ncbi:MAG: hypothetical protein QM477_02070 [Planctomycetota bacterium]
MRFFVLPLLLVMACAVLPACSSPVLDDESGRWSERILTPAPPLRDLLDACEYAMVYAGFPPGERDDSRNSVTSGWDLQLQPFRNKGRRWQGILRISVTESGETLVKSRVIQEKNVTQDDTLDSGEAEWERIEDDMIRSRILLQHLVAQLHLDS